MTKIPHFTYGLSDDEVLYHLLEKELTYYRVILNLTQIEHEKLKSNHAPHEMGPLLKRKKVLLSCIKDIEKTLVPLKKFWRNKASQNSKTTKINELLTNLCNILDEILQLDLVNQKILKEQLSRLKPKSEVDGNKSYSPV